MTKEQWIDSASKEYTENKLKHQRLFNEDDVEYAFEDGAKEFAKILIREIRQECYEPAVRCSIYEFIKSLGVIDD